MRKTRETFNAESSGGIENQVEAEAVRLTAPFGFITEIDAVYFKPAGSVITNPAEIAALRERGAPLEAV